MTLVVFTGTLVTIPVVVGMDALAAFAALASQRGTAVTPPTGSLETMRGIYEAANKGDLWPLQLAVVAALAYHIE